jgi:hypothetical protein
MTVAFQGDQGGRRAPRVGDISRLAVQLHRVEVCHYHSFLFFVLEMQAEWVYWWTTELAFLHLS